MTDPDYEAHIDDVVTSEEERLAHQRARYAETCAWCNERPVPQGRGVFCSLACHESYLRWYEAVYGNDPIEVDSGDELPAPEDEGWYLEYLQDLYGDGRYAG